MSLDKIKAVMFDVDGTLIDKSLIMTPKMVETIKALKANGYVVTTNTGRPSFGNIKVLESNGVLEDFDYLFSCNGVELIDNKTKERKLFDYVNKQTVRMLGDYFNIEHFCVAYYDKENKYLFTNHAISNTEAYNAWGTCRYVKMKEVDFSKFDDEVPKAVILFEPEYYEEALDRIAKLGQLDVDIVRSGDHVFEVIPKGNSKGTGVDKLAEMLGITNDEILCFGDTNSDVPALINCVGCMVGNDELAKKEGILYCTEDVKHDGVYNFCKKHNLI